jgi:hypothetical protein
MAAWIPPSEAEVARYFLRLNNWAAGAQTTRRARSTSSRPPSARPPSRSPGAGASCRSPVTSLPSRRSTITCSTRFAAAVPRRDRLRRDDLLWPDRHAPRRPLPRGVRGEAVQRAELRRRLDHGGATWGALDPWFEGLVTRGVLLGCRGRPPRGLRCAGPARDTAGSGRGHGSGGGQRVEPGDVVVIRSGREAYEASRAPVPAASGQGIPGAPARPGLHIACIEWLRPHDVASDRLGHDGRAPGGVRRAPVRRAPRDPDPGPLPHRRHVSGAPRGRLCGRGTRRVSVHRSAAPDHGQHRLAL